MVESHDDHDHAAKQIDRFEPIWHRGASRDRRGLWLNNAAFHEETPPATPVLSAASSRGGNGNDKSGFTIDLVRVESPARADFDNAAKTAKEPATEMARKARR